ncbi:thiamine-phosphate pyrophosphorylase [Helicobacter sp. MIT 99-5507]|uniref:thiamine-phosphate pyrophosphorylase n=1 Tax=Helicobacter sp. MIT 99-5507 TaxID=152489 RepID=UPI000E1F83A0|nr:thiamine-phosphate pyrophosphorylase [Helicobacter sp. MIT 99-5507]RDU57932.1 thiamine-phosphate pyrophosphorylase [Helicobacter sp. MIT 99-5507]
MIYRILDANLNRLREGIRVVEDITRYSLNSKTLSKRLKELRHKARINTDLLHYRDIKNDVSKQSNNSEATRKNLKDISIANFKRSQESARVIEEILKLDSSLGDYLIFKNIRYELYDIEIEYFKEFKE